MKTAFQTFSIRSAGALLAAAVLATGPVPVMAQERGEETRIRKLEAEVRALQRKVFPGGDARFFEPQIQPGTTPAAPSNVANPAATAITDVLARLDALESQMQRLTDRSEEQANALSDMERRLAAIESGSNPGDLAGAAPVAGGSSADPAVPATTGNLAAMTGVPPAGAAPAPASPAAPASAAGPSAARIAAVQAIAKPQTDDAGDDEYSYGFRLWNAGVYPEARQQLIKYVEQYPTHSRISFGRNLLGRAFLDDGMPEEASRWFLKNYRADKNGARAPDSLLYLAIAQINMNETRRACIALAEFGSDFPTIATGRLANDYEANRRRVTCG